MYDDIMYTTLVILFHEPNRMHLPVLFDICGQLISKLAKNRRSMLWSYCHVGRNDNKQSDQESGSLQHWHPVISIITKNKH